MRTIKFENNDYLDSTGIVNNKEKLSDLLKRKNSFITLIRTTDLEFTTTVNWERNFVAMQSSINNGNGYLIDDGNGRSISIGKNVKRVKVVGWLALYANDKNSAVEVMIQKNNLETSAYELGATNNISTTLYKTATQILSVNEGDKLDLNITLSNIGTYKIYSGNNSLRQSCGFRVEVYE